MQFQGCVIIVSHDRYFMDKITDHLFVFDGKGNVADFPGNYSDFRVFRQEGEQQDTGNGPEQESREAREAPKVRKGKLSYSQQRELQSLERGIAQLEARKRELETLFTNPELPGEELNDLSREMSEVMRVLEEKTERWFELSAIEEA